MQTTRHSNKRMEVKLYTFESSVSAIDVERANFIMNVIAGVNNKDMDMAIY